MIAGAPASQMKIVADPSGTADVPVYSLRGYASSLHAVVEFMVIKNVTKDAQGFPTGGDVFLTSNTDIVTLLTALAHINAVAGEQLGTVSFS